MGWALGRRWKGVPSTSSIAPSKWSNTGQPTWQHIGLGRRGKGKEAGGTLTKLGSRRTRVRSKKVLASRLSEAVWTTAMPDRLATTKASQPPGLGPPGQPSVDRPQFAISGQ